MTLGSILPSSKLTYPLFIPFRWDMDSFPGGSISGTYTHSFGPIQGSKRFVSELQSYTLKRTVKTRGPCMLSILFYCFYRNTGRGMLWKKRFLCVGMKKHMSKMKYMQMVFCDSLISIFFSPIYVDASPIPSVYGVFTFIWLFS